MQTALDPVLVDLPERLAQIGHPADRVSSGCWKLWTRLLDGFDSDQTFDAIRGIERKLPKFCAGLFDEGLSLALDQRLILPTQARRLRKAALGRDDLSGVLQTGLMHQDPVVHYIARYVVTHATAVPGMRSLARMIAACNGRPDSDLYKTALAHWHPHSFASGDAVLAMWKAIEEAFRIQGSRPLSRAGESLWRVEAGRATQFAAWSQCPVILRMDPTLIEQIGEVDATARLPLQLLTRLPFWCCFIDVNGAFEIDGSKLQGFFVSIVSDDRPLGADDFKVNLLIQPVEVEQGKPFAGRVLIPVDLAATSVADGVRQAIGDDALAQVGSAWAERVAHVATWAVHAALYLCSDEPDYGGAVPPQAVFNAAAAASLSKQPAAKKAIVHAVGFRIGAAIRRARDEARSAAKGDGATVIPHWRKSHFHLYWTGPGRQIPRVKWLAPIPVNLTESSPAPIAIRKVKT